MLSQETFAALLRRASDSHRGDRQLQSSGKPGRFREEQQVVSRAFPAGTRRASDGQFNGWVYEIANEFGDRYQLFAYFDPPAGLYRVALLAPRLGGELDAHAAHLFSDGRICLNEQSGCADLASAYARSALWCRGVSLVRRGHRFQFNRGQGK